MTIRSLGSRLDNLERRISTDTVDLDAEAAQYGELVWGDRTGSRCYTRDYVRDGETGGQLAIVGGPGGTVIYEVVGISFKDLV